MNHPTGKRPEKAAVREWLARRRLVAEPPPGIAEIRRALGWGAPEPDPEPAGGTLAVARGAVNY